MSDESSHAITTDADLIEAWLHGRSEHTQRGYRADLEGFLEVVGVPLADVSLVDIQAYADELEDRELAKATIKRKLSAVRSLFRFAVEEVGYLEDNPALAVRSPKATSTLAERILTEEEVFKLVTFETDPRNHMLIRLMYSTAGTFDFCSRRSFSIGSSTDTGPPDTKSVHC